MSNCDSTPADRLIRISTHPARRGQPRADCAAPTALRRRPSSRTRGWLHSATMSSEICSPTASTASFTVLVIGSATTSGWNTYPLPATNLDARSRRSELMTSDRPAGATRIVPSSTGSSARTPAASPSSTSQSPRPAFLSFFSPRARCFSRHRLLWSGGWLSASACSSSSSSSSVYHDDSRRVAIRRGKGGVRHDRHSRQHPEHRPGRPRLLPRALRISTDPAYTRIPISMNAGTDQCIHSNSPSQAATSMCATKVFANATKPAKTTPAGSPRGL